MITSKKCWIYFLSSFVKLVWSSVLTGVSAGLHTLIHQVRVHWERLNDSWGCDWTNCLSVTFKTTNQDILLFHPVATAFNSSWEDLFLEKTTLVLFIFLLLKKCCPALIKQPILQRPCWVCSKAHSAFSSIQSMQIDFSIKLSSIKLYDRQEVSSSINGNVCLQKCCKKKKKRAGVCHRGFPSCLIWLSDNLPPPPSPLTCHPGRTSAGASALRCWLSWFSLWGCSPRWSYVWAAQEGRGLKQ